MAVTLGRDVLLQYRRFSLYNSPFVAHNSGCAIDLYPGDEQNRVETAPSPVAGEVLETRAVDAPPQPYAADQDYLILVDTGEYVARLLHVKPGITAGDTVAVGDPLGTLVRAGFFAPWVPNHIHLGFREQDANHHRASGSLPIDVTVDPEPVPWDGTGTVAGTGETWAWLDNPAHPAPGKRFAGIESDGGVLDGGFPHYDGGGLLGGGSRAEIAGRRVGSVSGRDVTWRDCTVLANDEPVTGIALFCTRDRLGVKLVGKDISLEMREEVTVTVDV
ncbi:hypothetical protein [Salinibaculum salinum]|uniref:hypothetical protein n=1 Tax=Salinibaculum salinum TaxID=3131996 RepID=UPI0030EF338D